MFLASALVGVTAYLALQSLADPNRRMVELLGDRRTGPTARPWTWWLDRLGETRWARMATVDDGLWSRSGLARRGWPRERLIGLKLFLPSIAGAGAGLLALAVPIAWILGPVTAVAAFRLPDMALARVARRRQGRIQQQVGDLVELLVVTIEAGLSPPVALHRSAQVLDGPLGEELRAAVRSVELGVPFRDSLGELVDRTDAPGLRHLVRTLGRSQRLGASIGAGLRGVADELRAERRFRTEESARRAPVKMLFPLVFLVLPAFLLLTVGPVLLATIRSLH